MAWLTFRCLSSSNRAWGSFLLHPGSLGNLHGPWTLLLLDAFPRPSRALALLLACLFSGLIRC